MVDRAGVPATQATVSRDVSSVRHLSIGGAPTPRPLLAELEASGDSRPRKTREPAAQLRFIEEPNPALEHLEAIDVDQLTPIEAITRLYELKRLANA